MYNTLYRTEIENQDHRKFLDTFMGPNAIAASMMAVVRNYNYLLACRVAMDILIPLTRPGTLKIFQNLTFTILKTQTFAESFLHTRIFRQLFETGLDMFTFAVFWFMTKYKNKYIDPPPPPLTTAATANTTTAATANSTTAATTTMTSSSAKAESLPTTTEHIYNVKTTETDIIDLEQSFDDVTSTPDYNYISFKPGTTNTLKHILHYLIVQQIMSRLWM